METLMILNIRGTNGSGKTTLARRFIHQDATVVDLVDYKLESGKPRTVTGYLSPAESFGPVCVVGSYRTQCGGMDTIPSFDLSQKAILRATSMAADIICEGILASTVFGSWGKFAKEMNEFGRPFAFAYLTTPLDICLQRIYERRKEVAKRTTFNEQLVRDKFKAIAATRDKARRAGFLVYDIPFETSAHSTLAILKGKGDSFRV